MDMRQNYFIDSRAVSIPISEKHCDTLAKSKKNRNLAGLTVSEGQRGRSIEAVQEIPVFLTTFT